MGYKKLLWGFIFLFDLRIGGFDILPDIIGYVLFYQGLGMLEEKNILFAKAKNFSVPMIFISIFDIYKQTTSMNSLGNSSFGIIGLIIGLIITLINLFMVFNICMGIKEEARDINDLELESQAKKAWDLYIISNILVSLSLLFLMLLQLLFIVVFIVSIISYVLMLRLMSAANNRLE